MRSKWRVANVSRKTKLLRSGKIIGLRSGKIIGKNIYNNYLRIRFIRFEMFVLFFERDVYIARRRTMGADNTKFVKNKDIQHPPSYWRIYTQWGMLLQCRQLVIHWNTTDVFVDLYDIAASFSTRQLRQSPRPCVPVGSFVAMHWLSFVVYLDAVEVTRGRCGAHSSYCDMLWLRFIVFQCWSPGLQDKFANVKYKQ